MLFCNYSIFSFLFITISLQFLLFSIMLQKNINRSIIDASPEETNSSSMIASIRNKMKKLGKIQKKILLQKQKGCQNIRERSQREEYSEISIPTNKQTKQKMFLLSQSNNQTEKATKNSKSEFNALYNLKNIEVENNEFELRQLKLGKSKGPRKQIMSSKDYYQCTLDQISSLQFSNRSGFFSFLHNKGIKINFSVQVIKALISVFVTVSLLLIFSLQVVFPSISSTLGFSICKIFLLIVMGLYIVFNFFVVRKMGGKTLETLGEIMKNYIQSQFLIQLICFIVLLTDICFNPPFIKYFRFLYVSRIRDLENQISQLDYLFTIKFNKEQYWHLVRLIAGNFFIAHIFALLLLMISEIQTENNWLIKAGHGQKTELQKYIWAYYWSVTTMMSVGYGDLTPANYKQAICLVFVESISCIMMAYTINCVGQIMLNIRNRGLEKQKKLKILKQITENNQITSLVEQKIANYIQQTVKIQQKFNYQEQRKFVNELPSAVKSDLLFQCNSKLFQTIQTMQNYSVQSLRELAHKVELSIAHPEQIILSPAHKSRQIKILKQGVVGYFPINSRLTQSHAINQLKVGIKQSSQLIYQGLFNYSPINFNIKSISYSIIYQISYDKFIESIRKNQSDFQLFCMQRDRHRKSTTDIQSIQCGLCPNKRHTRAYCSKLHFIPYKTAVICKWLQNMKQGKAKRSKNWRLMKKCQRHAYKIYVKIADCRRKSCCQQDYVDTEEQSQIHYYQILRNLIKGNQLCRQLSSAIHEDEIIQEQSTLINCQEQTFKKQVKNLIEVQKAQRIKQKNNQKPKYSIKSIRNYIQSSPYFDQQHHRKSAPSEFDKQIKKNHSYNFQFPFRNTLTLENRVKSKRMLYNSELEEMVGIQCDVVRDYQRYFPTYNSVSFKNKSLKLSSIHRAGAKRVFSQVQVMVKSIEY